MKRRILSLLMVLALIISAVPAMSFSNLGGVVETLGTEAFADVDVASLPEYTADADLSAGAAYKISSADTLKLIQTGENKTFSGVTLYLANDIENVGAFTPIGPGNSYITQAFSGTFDGQGHRITGLNISSGTLGVGLFEGLNGATVRNLRIEVNINANCIYVGGIAGKVQGPTVIECCEVKGTIVNTDTKKSTGGTGGIVGGIGTAGLEINSCANFADVTYNYRNAAGIIGYGAKPLTIRNCYNAGDITSDGKAGGIIGQASGTSASKVKVLNSYNIGHMNGTGNKGRIVAFASNVELTGCYSIYVGEETGTGVADLTVGSITENDEGKAALLAALNSSDNAFTEDSGNINDGYPILTWQGGAAAVKEPKITISGEDIYQTQDNSAPQTTLTVQYKDMDTQPTIAWSITEGSDVVSIEAPENADASNKAQIVKAKKAGTAKIHAATTYETEELEADFEIKVFPYITGMAYKKSPVAGENYRINVYTLGGQEYDYDGFPALDGFVWKYYESNSSSDTNGTTITGKGPEIAVPSGVEGKYLEASLTVGGRIISLDSFYGYRKQILSADAGAVANDKSSLNISTDDIKAATTLNLPTTGANGSTITWDSSNTAVISNTGVVTLPESGTVEVTLTATLTKGSENSTKTFSIKVWSVAELNNPATKLNNAVKALGDFYKLNPQYGKDTNVLDMVKADLKKKGYEDINVAIKSIEKVSGDGTIADNGNITYFYADPNTTPAVRIGSYNVTFTFSIGEATKDKTVSTVFGWNVDKVKSQMKTEIMDKISVSTAPTADFELPKVVDGKKWALIEWTSSDDSVIEISTEKQTDADHLFENFVAKIHPQTTDKDVTLTAKINFQFADSAVESPIDLTATYTVTVPRDDSTSIEDTLLAKIEAGLTGKGLKDYVTKATLDTSAVYNDIQLPTTDDFDVDGKYYPVTLKSSNTDVLTVPKGANNARAYVWRPLGNEDDHATLTITITDKKSGRSASKDIDLTIKPLTDAEINDEIALMDEVKAHYFDGIKGSNTSADNITSNLTPFVEVYRSGSNLTWVRNVNDMVNHGIIAAPIPNWQDLEQWRLFKSSNAASITHENLLVTRQEDSKAVTITSYLSSETLGKYQEKYPNDERFKKLYNQPVSAELIVTGTNPQVDPQTGSPARPVAQKLSANIRIQSANSTWLTAKVDNMPEGSTVFDVFDKVMKSNGYTYAARGSYITSISNGRETLGEFDEGQDSGWMYKVNGTLPGVYMASYTLTGGENIVVFFTRDYTQEIGGHSKTEIPADQAQKTEPIAAAVTGETVVNGRTVSNVEVSEETIKKAAEEGKNITIAVEATKPATDKAAAPAVSISLPKGIDKAPVSIPVVEADSTTTVLMKVNEDGTLTPVVMSVLSEDGTGMVATVEEGNYVVVENKVSFSDVQEDAWYESGVNFTASRGLMVGTGEGKFDQQAPLTTAQTAAVIGRMKGEGTSESWNAAVEKFGNTEINNRQNTISMLYEAYKELGGTVATVDTGKVEGFNDADAISAENMEAVRWAIEMGLINGVGEGRIDPMGELTRGQFSTMIERFVKLVQGVK